MMIIVIVLALIWAFCELAAFCIVALCKPSLREEKRKKRHFPVALAAVLLTCIYFLTGWYHAHHIAETDYTIYSDKVTSALKIALIADAHMGTTFDADGFSDCLQRIEDKHPDVLLIAGDLVDDATSLSEMEEGAKVLGEVNVPYGVFFAYGNHDKGYSGQTRGYGASKLEAALKEQGVTILEDQVFPLRSDCILIGRADASTGLSDGGYEEGGRAEIASLIKNAGEKYTIILDHQPNDYDAEAAAGADLVLSGHTHGGQLIPINRIGELIGANDRTYGHEKRENTDFIVTSGISAWEIPFKTGCRSEYVIIDLLPAAER